MSDHDILSRREAAKLIKKIRADQEYSPNRVMMENFVWAIYDGFNEIDFQDVEISEDEVGEILQSVPATWESEE